MWAKQEDSVVLLITNTGVVEWREDYCKMSLRQASKGSMIVVPARLFSS